ncbi:RRQRL motif-containing zinc-binding protein [Nocardiopsis dassonvillei]|uniref:RRQRL motif-containing zinc-binding protein n=1 Tax=Nocardiopsis dassonvillei TaxID=2014 RepID=UPI0033FE99D3
MARTSPYCYDPTGTRHGIPTWPRGWAPRGLATRRQLRALGLRPGGQHPVAQIMWRSNRGGSRYGYRVAYLYWTHLALPVRPMTEAKWRAIARAYLARCTCRLCDELHPYCLPVSNGRTCPPGTGCSVRPV